MLAVGTQVRIRKEVLPSFHDLQGRVDEMRVAFVEKNDPCHGLAFLIFPRVGRKREFRAGWFNPKHLEIVNRD